MVRTLIFMLLILSSIFAEEYIIEFSEENQSQKMEENLNSLGFDYNRKIINKRIVYNVGPFYNRKNLDTAIYQIRTNITSNIHILKNNADSMSNRNNSIYVGVSFGYFTANNYKKFGAYNLTYNDDNPQVTGVLAGININKKFAIESSVNFVQEENIQKSDGNTSENGKIDHKYISTKLKYTHNLYHRFNMFATLGVVFDKVSLTGLDSKWETDFTAGTGLEFNINKKLSMQVGYETKPESVIFATKYLFQK